MQFERLKKNYKKEITSGEIKVNYSKPDFSKIADTDEEIYGEYDEVYNGYSYYWRGAATTNYLKFAGYCWRIIRINGDGSIRLIYEETTCHENGEETTDSIAVSKVAYNTNCNNSSYVGWTYNVGEQRTLSGTDSNAKTQLESWYNSNITGTNANKVAEGKYCNDRNTQNGEAWRATGETQYYAGFKRMYIDYAPTLACNSSDVYTLKVGLITADEAEMAGEKNENNISYYLYNGQNYWTMSPNQWYSGYSWAFEFFVRGSDGFLVYWGVHDTFGLRPVINIRSDITISNGNGTLNNPYIVAD